MGLYATVTPYFSNSTLLLIATEVSPKSTKCFFACFNQIGISFGIAIVYLLSLSLPSGTPLELAKDYSWRMIKAVPSVLTLVQVFLLLFVYTYDSPHHYVLKKENDLVILHITK